MPKTYHQPKVSTDDIMSPLPSAEQTTKKRTVKELPSQKQNPMEQNSSEQILSQYLKDLAQPVEVSPSDIKAIGLSYYDKISLFYDRDKDSVAVTARKKD